MRVEITTDVIRDLLPVYLAGEASDQTPALVEAHLATDPDLRRFVNEAGATDLGAVDSALPREHLTTTLFETQRLLRLRQWLWGAALFFMLLPFTVWIHNSAIRFLLIRDLPWLAGLMMTVSAGLSIWFGPVVQRCG